MLERYSVQDLAFTDYTSGNPANNRAEINAGMNSQFPLLPIWGTI